MSAEHATQLDPRLKAIFAKTGHYLKEQDSIIAMIECAFKQADATPEFLQEYPNFFRDIECALAHFKNQLEMATEAADVDNVAHFTNVCEIMQTTRQNVRRKFEDADKHRRTLMAAFDNERTKLTIFNEVVFLESLCATKATMFQKLPGLFGDSGRARFKRNLGATNSYTDEEKTAITQLLDAMIITRAVAVRSVDQECVSTFFEDEPEDAHVNGFPRYVLGHAMLDWDDFWDLQHCNEANVVMVSLDPPNHGEDSTDEE